uniref:Uncharacterized protein n=1 Tax=Haptolina ericina TaxID=156174 RepID=A0A7S3EVB8_9EUKA
MELTPSPVPLEPGHRHSALLRTGGGGQTAITCPGAVPSGEQLPSGVPASRRNDQMATRVGECADGDELSLRPMIKDPMRAMNEIAEIASHWYVVHPRLERPAIISRFNVGQQAWALHVQQRPVGVKQVGHTARVP